MKNFFLVAMTAALLWSCSDNDNPTYYPTPVTGTAVPSKVIYDNGTPADLATYTITYDSGKRIRKIVKNAAEDRTFLFTYNADGQVATVAITGVEPGLYAFDYDAFMRLEKITSNGSPATVNYNGVTGEYTVGSLHFKYLDNGEFDTLQTFKFHYDASQKGAFANVNSSYQLLGMLIDGIFLQSCSKTAYDTWDINGNVGVLFTHQLNSEGMPVESVISGLFNTTVKYEYIRL